MKQNRSWKWVVLFSVTVLFSSCLENFKYPAKTAIKTVYNGYKWNRFAPLEGKFEISHVNRTYELAFSLSVVDGFELDEVPLEIVITSPDGQENVLNRTMEVKKDGNYVGTAYGDIWTTKLIIYPEKEFLQAGTYSVFIQNRTQYYDLEKVASLEFTVHAVGRVKK